MSYPVDFEPVCALLEQQLGCYDKLLALAEEKRDCLIKGSVEALEKLVRAEAVQLKQIAALENKRQAAVQALGVALKITGEPVLSDLIPYSAGEQSQRLQASFALFTELIPRLTEVNQTNRSMLDTNMQLNEWMLDALTGPEDPLNNFYGADGSEAEEKISSPSIFDQQI